MPVLVGTPSMLIVSRVQSYQTCSVDLSWQCAVHACQRCPKSALTANVISVTPINQPGLERAKSRFCPAGVHMSSCIPASEIFGVSPKSSTHPTSQAVAGSNDLTSGCSLSFGPPNLPLPAVSPNHPVHAANLARASYPPSVCVATTLTSIATPVVAFSTSPTKPTISMTTVHHFYPTDSTTGPTTSICSTASATITPSSPTTLVSTVDLVSSPKNESLNVGKHESVLDSKADDRPSQNGYSNNKIPIKAIDSPKLDIVAEPVNKEAVDSQMDTTHNAVKETQIDYSKVNSSSTISNELNNTDEINVAEKVLRKDGFNKSELSTTLDHNRSVSTNRTVPNNKEDVDRFNKQIKSINRPTEQRVTNIKQQKSKDKSIIIDSTISSGQNQTDLIKADNKTATAAAATTTTVNQRDQRQVNIINHIESAEITNQSCDGTAKLSTNTTTTTTTTVDAGLGDVAVLKAVNHKPSSEYVGQPTKDQSVIQSAKHVINNLTIVNGTNSSATINIKKQMIPSFHFPIGTTHLSSEEINQELERIKHELNKLAESVANESETATTTTESSLPYSMFGQVAKILRCPLYWKYAIYMHSGGTSDKSPTSVSGVSKMWSSILNLCYDDASKFVHLLTRGRTTYLIQSDLSALIQDILESHPGLAFLKTAKAFHSRYVATVVARIYFSVNTSWSGRITLGELRRSNFLTVLASLEQEEDINLITQYFSYEHFYVIYCKFWELDEDHDLMISRADLARHNNYAISERMIDRIFSGAVTRGSSFKDGVMTYPDFVWFLLAEEDKRHPRSIEYWFRCMDLDGDGLLSMYELEYFYSEQLARMEEMGIEPISFEDCLCQCLDMVKPVLVDKIRLSDMKQCRLCHIFFDTFFNLPKYLQHEQRDPFANLRDIEEGLNELSDWDRYAAEAYEMLVNMEGVNQEDGADDDDEEEDEEEEGEEDDVIDNTGGLLINDHNMMNENSNKTNKNHVDDVNNNKANCDSDAQNDNNNVDESRAINKIDNLNTDSINLQPAVIAGEL